MDSLKGECERRQFTQKTMGGRGPELAADPRLIVDLNPTERPKLLLIKRRYDMLISIES